MSQGSSTEYSQADLVDYTPPVDELSSVSDPADFEISDDVFLH